VILHLLSKLLSKQIRPGFIKILKPIPGIGQDVFKMNSFKTTDFGFRDFEIEKPSRITFQ